jgi:hypothetical protein
MRSAILKPLLEVKVNIQKADGSSELEHVFWLEGMRGGRLEGVCPWCSRMTLISVAELQSNASVRCWHCRAESESLTFLNEAQPGLHQQLMGPAIAELMRDIQDMFKRTLG